MDLASIIGIILAFVCLVAGITMEGGNIVKYIAPSAFGLAAIRSNRGDLDGAVDGAAVGAGDGVRYLRGEQRAACAPRARRWIFPPQLHRRAWPAGRTRPRPGWPSLLSRSRRFASFQSVRRLAGCQRSGRNPPEVSQLSSASTSSMMRWMSSAKAFTD